MSANVFKNKEQAKIKSIQIMLLFFTVVISGPFVLMWLGSFIIPSETMWELSLNGLGFLMLTIPFILFVYSFSKTQSATASFAAFMFGTMVVVLGLLTLLFSSKPILSSISSKLSLLTQFNFWWFVGWTISAIILTVSIYQYMTLKSSLFSITKSFGADHISKHLSDPNWKRYQNIAEEQAIAADISLPSLYVFYNEQINALVVGKSEEMTVLMVSSGALNLLDREELSALVAHEYGHIVNGDVHSNLVALIVIRSLRSLNDLALRILLVSLPIPFLIFIFIFLTAPLWITGSFGTFAAKLLQLWLSRSQEYLADAHAVQFTRNNRAMAGVLAKAYVQQKEERDLPYSDVALANFSHMTFNSMMFNKRSAVKPSWTRTHPPLTERIERICPGFLKEFLTQSRQIKNGKSTDITQKRKTIKHAFNFNFERLFSVEFIEQMGMADFEYFINEQIHQSEAINTRRLDDWEDQFRTLPQLSLMDLRLKLVNTLKFGYLDLLGQINFANIIGMLSNLIEPNTPADKPLSEHLLAAQLSHVLSAFSKLSHQDASMQKAAYQRAKLAYPTLTKDKTPIDIVRLIYDLKLLARLPFDDKQKLLTLVQEIMREDGEVTEEEKSLSYLLSRTM